ncbi:unnamed protein product [Rhizoctonia solani]|uniref:NACHT domain-containing protein n=1 Tax=Rhizoctonia solani TaxID=456999 RepID=A0A8H3GG99_9AGAM|nr:unnamed protein product [Rhizoctonia solani]
MAYTAAEREQITQIDGNTATSHSIGHPHPHPAEPVGDTTVRLGQVIGPHIDTTVEASKIVHIDSNLEPVSILCRTPSTIATKQMDVEPSNVTQQNEPSTRGQGNQNVAWKGLRESLQILGTTSSMFPPLSSAVGSLISCLDGFEASLQTRQEFRDLAIELATMIQSLQQYMIRSPSVFMSNSTTNVIMALNRDVTEIRERLSYTSVPRRVIRGAGMDEEELIRYYRRIQSHFQQLQTSASMCAWSIANEQLVNARLERLNPVKQAAYDSSFSTQMNRRGCTEGTRVGILDSLDSWLCNSAHSSIYWMNGMAGTGKTTVASTFCERVEQRKLLGASFFCTRSSAECRDVARILPTISYQLARYSIPFQSALCEIMEQNPDIGSKNILKQFEKLLKEPLQRAKDTIPNNLIVVIDALDECDDRKEVELILDMLFHHLDHIPLKFFITSRPEQEIFEKMSTHAQLREVLHLHDIEQSLVQGDIELYLKEELEPMSPSPSEIDQLAQRSGTLFIYAATLVRYISGKRSVDSRKRLQAVLDLTTKSTKQHAQIDALYTAVLDSALREDGLLEIDDTEDILTVLRIVLLAQEPVSVEIIAGLADIESPERVVHALQPLRSVLHQSEDTGLVSTLHASFPDFMFSNERSRSYFCDVAEHSQLLARRSFLVMREQLRFNICDLRSSFVPDGKVENIQERIKLGISPILAYTCRYWGSHLVLAPHLDILQRMLEDFLSHRLLFWMEVLNLRRDLSLGVDGLLKVQGWLQRAGPSLSDLVTFFDDVRSFVTQFAVNPVSQSTPHIYISSLAFCPESNSVHKHYRKATQGLLELKGSLMDRREAAPLAIWSFDSEIQSLALSPDGTRVVIGCLDDTVSIFSAYDGILQVGPLQGHPNSVGLVAFPPEGVRVVSASLGSIRVWNVYNGTRISGRFQGHMRYINSFSFSPDGTRVVSGGHDCTVRIWSAHDAMPLLDPFADHTDSVLRVIFSPDGSLVASASSDQTIRLWNSYDGTPVVAPLRGHTGPVDSLVFTPDGTHIISGSSDKTVRVWSTSDGSAIPIKFEGCEGGINSLAISPDGMRIAAGCNDHAVRVWKINDGKLASGPFFGHTAAVKSVTYSPDGTRVLSGSADRSVRVWNVRDGMFPPAPPPPLDAVVNIRSVAFCPDNIHFLSSGRHAVRVWDITDGSFITSPNHTNFFPTPLCSLSPDGYYISGTSKHGKIQITSTIDGSLVAGPFEIERTLLSTFSFSHNNKAIIMGCQDGTIKVCALEGENVAVGSFVAHRRGVSSLSESFDCSLLVSYSDFEFTLRVWDIVTPALNLKLSSDASTDSTCETTYAAIYEGWRITDDGWVTNNSQHLLFWLPPDVASAWCSPYAKLVITKSGTLQVPKQKPFVGDQWVKCYLPK